MTIVALHVNRKGRFAVAAGRIAIGRAQNLVKASSFSEQAMRLRRPSLFIGFHVYLESGLCTTIISEVDSRSDD